MRLLRMPGCRVLAGLAFSNLLCLMPLQAQLILPRKGETLPSFEVATIKPAAPDARMVGSSWLSDGLRFDNVSLSQIIRDAYHAHSAAQLVGGPQALLKQRFDVRTKMDAEDAARFKTMSPNDRERFMRLMLQALLRDRFQLKMHVEMRELPMYALVVAKGGPKLQPTAPPNSKPASPTHAAAKSPIVPGQLPHRPPKGTNMMMQSSQEKVQMSVSGGTMELLAATLTGREATEERLVIDKTGLTGKYDWYLDWTPPGAEMGAQMESNGAGGGAPVSDAPGLFTALKEQLGLRLESEKGPVQVIVIDHLEPPSPN